MIVRNIEFEIESDKIGFLVQDGVCYLQIDDGWTRQIKLDLDKLLELRTILDDTIRDVKNAGI